MVISFIISLTTYTYTNLPSSSTFPLVTVLMFYSFWVSIHRPSPPNPYNPSFSLRFSFPIAVTLPCYLSPCLTFSVLLLLFVSPFPFAFLMSINWSINFLHLIPSFFLVLLPTVYSFCSYFYLSFNPLQTHFVLCSFSFYLTHYKILFTFSMVFSFFLHTGTGNPVEITNFSL